MCNRITLIFGNVNISRNLRVTNEDDAIDISSGSVIISGRFTIVKSRIWLSLKRKFL